MKKLVVVLLLFISLGGTVGAYAYWDDLIRNTNNTLEVGEGTSLVVTSDVSVPQGKTLVPKNTVLKANDIDEIELKYTVSLSQDVLNDLYLYVRTENIKINDSETYSNLVNIDVNASVSTIERNEIIVTALITLSEPENQDDYSKVRNSTITFDILFDASTVKRDKLENEVLLAFSNELIEDDVDDYLPVAPDVTDPYIVINGQSNVTIEVGSDYQDPLFTAYNTNGGIESIVWTNGYYSTKIIGTYTLSYSCYSSYDNAFCENETRVINVVDTTPPVINIEDEVYLSLNEYFNPWSLPSASDLGDYYVKVTATGIFDVDTSTKGEYIVTYYAEDDTGNETEKVVTYIVE